MSQPTGEPIRYRVSYSDRVRTALRDLMVRARERGYGPAFRDALIEIDRRLSIYPQFGQPIRDLTLFPGQLWIGVVPPLVVH